MKEDDLIFAKKIAKTFYVTSLAALGNVLVEISKHFLYTVFHLLHKNIVVVIELSKNIFLLNFEGIL